jgi:ribosomal protein S27E
MKTVSIQFLIMIACLCACSGNKAKTDETSEEANVSIKSKQETKAPAEKKLPFERGSYVEKSSVMGIEMKKTVYFDRWGDWMATEDKSEMTIMGHIHKTDKLEIVKGSTHWNIDLIEKTGTSYELNIPMGMAAALGAAIGGKMMDGMEMKELGEEDYLGYKCKKTQIKYSQMNMDVTTLSYGNLTMKTEGTMGQSKISTKIVSIDLSAPPASKFEVPEGVKIEKAEN